MNVGFLKLVCTLVIYLNIFKRTAFLFITSTVSTTNTTESPFLSLHYTFLLYICLILIQLLHTAVEGTASRPACSRANQQLQIKGSIKRKVL